jgi:Uma2 family endonuclease
MSTATTNGPAKPALEFDFGVLPYDDGIPMETPRHRFQMNLLIESLDVRWADRDDFYVGGNMFVHFSLERARNRDFRGPDFFAVLGVPKSPDRERLYWASWDEDGRLPDVIIELLSESTEHEDRHRKKEVYQNTFRTHEYFLYSPGKRDVEGFRLTSRYVPIRTNENGWLWCEKLDCWLGFWEGTYQNIDGWWLRFFEKDGTLVPTAVEAESKRRKSAELEIARLKAELAQLKPTP